MLDIFPFFRPLLHSLPPEAAHRLALWGLSRGFYLPSFSAPSPMLKVETLGLSFPNPVGIAAGFDKNAVAMNALLGKGFGFVEAGTVTPRPQRGNDKPRIFRLVEDEAVINRLGFNNEGLVQFVSRLKLRKRKRGIAGANIGKNKDTTDAAADYVTGLRAVYPHADYVTVNISSPNTQGLRALQQREALTELLTALAQVRAACMQNYGKRIPLLLKLAPDLGPKEMEDIVQVVLAQNVDGLIVGNTTITRPESLKSKYQDEQGGLSGRPLFSHSTARLKEFYRLTGGTLPIIGVGGISSAEDAYAKIRAGATLVQLYTAVVYQGFGLARKIQSGLVELLKRDGFSNIQQAVGVDAR